MLLGYARGKVGSLVFARLKGQQITRAYNPSPNDRKTNKQMTQRVKLPALVAFYQQNKSFFPFAFTNKKTTQSDYNAFVSANLKLADVPYYDKGLIAKGYPVVGPYQGTDGAVSEVQCSWGDVTNGAGQSSGKTPEGVVTSLSVGSEFSFEPYLDLGYFPIGALSQALVDNNPGIQNGDMITFYLVAYPAVKFGAVVDVDKLSMANVVASFQFNVDVASTETALKEGLSFTINGKTVFLSLQSNTDNQLVLASATIYNLPAYNPTDFDTDVYANVAMSICCVVSRNQGTQQVSRSRFALSPIAQSYYENVNSSLSLANAIASYGATGEALLENKNISYITGTLTTVTEDLTGSGESPNGSAVASTNIPRTDLPQTVTVTELANAPSAFTVVLEAEEAGVIATYNSVAVGQSLRVPAGYDLYSVTVKGEGISSETTGKVAVTFYEQEN